MEKITKVFVTFAVFLILLPFGSEAVTVEELAMKNERLETELAALRSMFNVLQAREASNAREFDRKNGQLEENLRELKGTMSDFKVRLNDTEELEARVTVLEESVADLEVDVVALVDDVEDVESDNSLQDQRLNTMEIEILDNDNDIEELVDITTGLTGQVLGLEVTVEALDQRVGDLESGDGGGNVTELETRVQELEEVTSQLTNDVSSLEDNDVTQDQIISSIEEDVTSLDQRVEDLESGGGGGGDHGDTVFLAALSANDSSSTNLVIFDWEVINPGGHYDSTTGQYTVPQNGTYKFSVHMTAYTADSDLNVRIYVDGVTAGSHYDAWAHEGFRFTTVLLELQAGQTVHVGRGYGAQGSATYLQSYFSGYMISAN